MTPECLTKNKMIIGFSEYFSEYLTEQLDSKKPFIADI